MYFSYEEKSATGLEIREYGHRDPSGWPRDTLYLQKLALTSPTSSGLSVGIVHSQTQAMEFFFFWETCKGVYGFIKLICAATGYEQLNSMAWIHEQTILTEQQLLVGEVIANFCG
jgi:hypothetical protein